MNSSNSPTSNPDKHPNRRRKHKNSKLGCPNCKKRRVKCSEDLPTCLNCIKHKVKCGYLDYSEEQLEELNRAKLQNEMEESIDMKTLVRTKSNTLPKSSGSKQAETGKRSSLEDDTDSSDINNFGKLRSNITTKGQSSPNGSSEQVIKESPANLNGDDGVNEILNFQHQAIKQNFDNLLSTSTTNDIPIIYPVYSIANPNLNFNDSNSLTSNSDIQPFTDHFNSGAFNWSYLSHSIDISELNNRSKYLPGAINSNTSFRKISKRVIDYESVLFNLLIKLGPSIKIGSSSLDEIRHLYIIWLNSIICQSFYSELMFSCLLNLTTNYLISNSLNSQHSSFIALVEKMQFKNLLIVTSIKHYAKVIKGLRILLNNNDNPGLCASISYILSLMSIYDPEVTLHSSNCFRDGLFSVLSYNIKLSIKNGLDVSLMISVHLQLMKNIERSIYLQGYNPIFLNEFKSTLESFGDILTSVSTYGNNNILKFVEASYKELLEYTNDTIANYIPTINNNLSNLDIQQEVLFNMVYKWVRLFPAKLLVITAKSDPFVKILYLFFKVLKKSLYAIFPQIKFFFLRDFDSPLMLDSFVTHNDFDIHDKELENPIMCCLPSAAYEPIKFQFKIMSGYLIRILTFLQKRLILLYRTIIHGETAKKLFPIDDIRKWNKSIHDIYKVRNEFNNAVGLIEVPIKSFKNTLIKPYHYPRLVKEYTDDTIIQDTHDVVDLLTLKSNGLLENDYDQTV